MQAVDEASLFAELYGSNTDVEAQSQAIVQQAIVPAAPARGLPAAEEVDTPLSPNAYCGFARSGGSASCWIACSLRNLERRMTSIYTWTSRMYRAWTQRQQASQAGQHISYRHGRTLRRRASCRGARMRQPIGSPACRHLWL